MPYEAKTNWKYDDTVTEKDLNRIEQGLKDAHVAEYKELTLEPGVQIVDVPEDTPFRMGEIRGRTLVNLLGRAGSCTDQTLWNLWQSSTATHSSFIGLQVKVHPDKVYGNAHNFIDNVKYDQAYVVVGNLENGTTGGRVRLETQEFDGEKVINSYYSNEITNVSIRQPMHLAFAISDSRTKRFSVNLTVVADATEVTGYFDSIRVYEIPKADVEKINGMTSEEVSAYYSYVDSMTNIINPYAIGISGNLLPPFTEWVLGAERTANVMYTQPYDIVITSPSKGQQAYYFDLVAVPNKTYTLSSSKGRMYCGVDDANGTKRYIADVDGGKVTFTTSSTAKAIRVQCLNLVSYIDINNPSTFVYGEGDFEFKNPMLTLTSELQSFSPMNRSVWAAECKLAANPVDGSNADMLNMNEDGLPYVLEKWGKLPLIEGQQWVLVATYTGFKQVGESNNIYPITGNQGLVVKHDGKLLPNFTGIPASSDMGTISQNSGQLHITVSNKDSGWGDNYKPEPDEIKSYFLGWKMYDTETSKTTEPYNRTDGKYKGWVRRNDAGQFVDGTGTLPTTEAPRNSRWTPYRLQYLKAKPTVKPVKNYETGLTLSKGWNMVEVSSDIMIREKAKPTYYSPNENYYINNTAVSGSLLKNKVSHMLRVYRNGQVDNTAKIENDANAYGKQHVRFLPSDFDPSAVYHVTYMMLDPTLSAPISGSIATNLRGTVTDMVSWASDAERRLSVVENGEQDNLSPESIGAAKKSDLDGLTKNSVCIKNGTSKDLNAYREPGLFFIGSLNEYTNSPSPDLGFSWGILRVETLGTTAYVVQSYTCVLNNVTFTRSKAENASGRDWTPWIVSIKADYDGILRLSNWLDIRGDAGLLHLYGTTHGYITFNQGGVRRGYVGIGDPNAPGNLTLSADNGNLWLNAGDGGVFVQGRNILYEIDQLKTSGVNNKQALVDALNAKGIAASINEDWGGLIAKVGQAAIFKSAYVSNEHKVTTSTTDRFNFFDMPAGTTKVNFTSDPEGTTSIYESSNYYNGTDMAFVVRDAFGNECYVGSSYRGQTMYLYSFMIDTAANNARYTYFDGDNNKQVSVINKAANLNPAGGLSFGTYIYGTGYAVTAKVAGLLTYA
ncbi:pyocin knob domain-containing protein [Paenibacillus sp. S-12]|uniref:pyocin knob domain-containing protein n=1 Tax=Paenibacillus sp. S-12 TaxID=3031371 RepID=UPI0025A11612|nr:pyocin knob domain-containing protein [Paenibacillus sp. S-12]